MHIPTIVDNNKEKYVSLLLSTMVGICIHPQHPSLYLHVDLQQHHLGKFLYNILLD